MRFEQTRVTFGYERDHPAITTLGELGLVAGARRISGFEVEACRLVACVAASQVARDDRRGEPLTEGRASQVLAQTTVHAHPSSAV